MELVIQIWWVCHSAGQAGLLLLKEGEWEGIETPEHIWKTRATDERQVSWPVSSLGRAEDHCPLGRLSSSPSYSDSPCTSSSSTGCKSNSGRQKGKGGTGIILMFWLGYLPWQHTFGPVPRRSCTQPLVLTEVKQIAKSSSQVQNRLYHLAVVYVLHANYTKYILNELFQLQRPFKWHMTFKTKYSTGPIYLSPLLCLLFLLWHVTLTSVIAHLNLCRFLMGNTDQSV